MDGAGQLPATAAVQSFGQELMITDVDAAASGTYECIAESALAKSTQPVSARFQLIVECKLLNCQ